MMEISKAIEVKNLVIKLECAKSMLCDLKKGHSHHRVLRLSFGNTESYEVSTEDLLMMIDFYKQQVVSIVEQIESM